MSIAQNSGSQSNSIASQSFVAMILEGSEPRDKVYGLYAILQRYGIRLQPPNYDKPISTIYRETAESIIKHDCSLDLLYYISATRVLPDLPSWVPDVVDGWFSWIPGFEFTTPSKGSAGRFEFGPEGDLSIFGLCVDTIECISDALEIWDINGPTNLSDEKLYFKDYRRVLHQFREWISFALKRDYVKEGPMRAFCMVTLQELALAFYAD
jgi:hypothetical protein